MIIKNSIPLQPLHTFVILFFFLSCLQFAINGSESAEPKTCISREREALLIFKRGLVDDGLLSSWGSEEDNKDCCQWIGVRCTNQTGHVTALNLSTPFLNSIKVYEYNYAHLEGKLSPSLLELHHLSYLDLHGNRFVGPIPNFIGSLVELKYLDLSDNWFHIIFPFQLGNLSKLRHLDIGYNHYYPDYGNITERLNVDDNLAWLSNLTSLIYLDMSMVNLSKAIHWINTITSLPSLSYVSLYDCVLSPFTSSPHSLINSSTSIATLLLDGNDFKGPIPDALGNMTSLTHLSLSGNQFEGVIPKSFGNLCNLQTLELEYNNFSGNLPDFLENFYGCAEGSLQSIDFTYNQLKGSLPDITRFSSLREVSLFRNKIRGPLPDFTGCSSLQRLALGNNEINGSVPHFIGCSSLRELFLHDNQLSGTLPESIGQLSMLESLDVSSNFLEGVISEVHLLNLTKLMYLSLSHNHLAIELSSRWVPPFQLDTIILNSCKLGPRFPRWIQTQKNFSYLDISNGGIADTIPMWFWDQSTTRLLSFFASSNAITGVLPDLSTKFGNYPLIDLSFNLLEGPMPLFPSNLTSLNLSGNKFSGGLTFLCALANGVLSFLDLSHNLLYGGLPEHCVKHQLKELVILNISHNKLSGEIPRSIGALSIIETMDLQNNSLSGELPLSLINCTRLNFLNLGTNKLSGNIPSWVGENLQNLYILIMRSNQFKGSIPLHLCHLVHLQLLDLSANALSGHIPQCFNNFTAMVQKGIRPLITSHIYMYGGNQFSRYVNLFNDSAVVQWKGREREFDKGLGLLKSIDLSQNELTGELPEAIFDLVEMVALNLSRNKLHGGVPQGIGKLISLESLDLSRNMFSGEIPSNMSALNFLSYLDLAYNNLSGRIPLGTQLQSFDASQYMGNEELCGPPLTLKCPGDEETQAPPTTVVGSEDEDEFYRWFYTGLAVGYAIAFWAVSGALLLYRPWRHAYFLLLGNIRDWLYVRVAICLAKCRLIYKGAN